MVVSSSLSLVLSSTLCVLLFGGMQMFKQEISATELSTIGGGFVGSWLFVLSLTAVNNLEVTVFGDGFQAQLFPEVVMCLGVSLFASALVHRVCVTTCLIFSLIALYYLSAKPSQSELRAGPTTFTAEKSKKKKY